MSLKSIITRCTPGTGGKMRSQVGTALYVLVLVCLMGVCPHILTTWMVFRCIAWIFPAIDMQAVGDAMYSFFLRLTLFFFIRSNGVKIHMYGDTEEIKSRDENVLYLANHQSSLDWIVACLVAMFASCLRRIKFVMKQELHWVPMVGFYLHQIGHIFVRRKGFRQTAMLRTLDHICKHRVPIWIAIFPEGTRFSPDDTKAIVKSREIANSNKLTPLQHQFTPRPKGSWLLLDQLRSHLQAVYNVTIVYEDPNSDGRRKKAPQGSDIFKGACPSVHIHVKRIPIEDTPKDEGDFGSWLHQQSVERDRLLTDYYSSRSFASWGPAEHCEVPVRTVGPAAMLAALLGLPVLLSAAGWSLYFRVTLFITLIGYAVFHVSEAF